ncbi:hypothetical protein Tco_0887731 [Tanacetum coccineum]
MRPNYHDPNALDNMKPWKRYCFHKFTMSSCYGKDVTEMQSLERFKMITLMDFDHSEGKRIPEIPQPVYARVGAYNPPGYAPPQYDQYYQLYPPPPPQYPPQYQQQQQDDDDEYDKVEESGDWNSPEFQDTANSGQKKETKAMVFYQMETEEVSDRFVAPCFVNGLEAYDGEINLGVEENMISNEYAVKLCLVHEVKRGNKVVKKELIVALKGEIYFVKFIINPEEDDVEPGVIFGRSFLRMTKAIADFGVGTVIIYPDIDPFLEETEEEGKSNDDWDHLLDFNIDDIPLLVKKDFRHSYAK